MLYAFNYYECFKGDVLLSEKTDEGSARTVLPEIFPIVLLVKFHETQFFFRSIIIFFS